MYNKKNNPKDFSTLKKYFFYLFFLIFLLFTLVTFRVMNKGSAHVNLIPFSEFFLGGKFEKVFNVFEIIDVVFLDKHPDLDLNQK